MAHSAVTLPDGRLHLREGPIDIVIGLSGTRAACAQARTLATAAFAGVLAGLAAEWPLLQAPLGVEPPPLQGPVARRMLAACWPHRRGCITPTAAMAGAVAEHVRDALAPTPGLASAYVNNGGAIALHLAPGERLHLGLVRSLAHAAPQGMVRVRAEDAVRGLATSGRAGRSVSPGIADAVTVLAADAAAAGAAATVIATAVDVDHPAVRRAPASSLDPDSDLGTLPVTTGVGPLPPEAVAQALCAGEAAAERLLAAGLIQAALLTVGGALRTVGTPLLEA